ncbi:MAG: hypothetical protein AAGF07_04910 [Patescibacteria group bacterium]
MENILIIISLYTLSIAFSEIAYYAGYNNHISRSFSQVSAAIVSILLPALLPLDQVLYIGVGFTIVMLIAKELNLLKGIYKHNNEEIGPVLFPIGLTIAAITFWGFQPAVFQICCLIVGFADSLAGLIGKSFGKITYQFSVEKTIEGSLVFFLTSVAIFILMITLNNLSVDASRIGRILASSVILTITEGSFGNGWDNLVLPFASGFTAVWIFV